MESINRSRLIVGALVFLIFSASLSEADQWAAVGNAAGALPHEMLEATPLHDPTPAEDSSVQAVDIELLRQIIRAEIHAEMASQDAAVQPLYPAPCADSEPGKTMPATWNNGWVAESLDQSSRIHVGGRLDFDNSWFSQDDQLLLGVSPDQRLKDGTLFRRARFRIDGRLSHFIDFLTEVNFATIQDAANVQDDRVEIGSVGLTDFHVTFRDQPLFGNIRLGRFLAPLSLERYSGGNVGQYMERSHVFDSFTGVNEYQNGVLVFDSLFGDLATYGTSFTWLSNSSINSFGFDAFDTGNYAFNARLTGLVLYGDQGRRLVHVGIGYQHQAVENNSFGLAARPLIRAGGGPLQTPNVVATGTFFTPNNANLVVFEGAAICGPLSLSAEHAMVSVKDVFENFDGQNYTGSRGDVFYQSTYIEGGLFVTRGDFRRYDRKTGVWGRVTPKRNASGLFNWHNGGPGAIELVARYTYLDLVDGSPILTPTAGGARAATTHDVTLGANWYLNAQTRLVVNYIHTRINSVVAGASGDFDGVGCRLHLDF